MNYCVQQELTLTDPEILLSEHYYRRLWLAVRNTDISRRDWLDELANTFRDFHGVVVTHEGLPYPLPLVDDIFGHDDDMRWLGYYMMADLSGKNPRSLSRKIERLQLLDLYFQMKRPHIAQHFIR